MHSDTPALGDLAGLAEREPAMPIEHAFFFGGDAREYFRIWIVNVALSLLTLGIWSAWATVRTRRYFQANTRVAGAMFVYSASPWSILIGRVLAATALVAYVVASQVSPSAYLIVLGVLFALTPLAVVRGLRFRARCSSWRGLHFRFLGSDGGAYRCFLLAWLLVPISAGLLFPYVRFLQKRFAVSGHRYGAREMRFDGTSGGFHGIYWGAWAIFVLTMLALQFVVLPFVESHAVFSRETISGRGVAAFYVLTVGSYVAFVLAWTMITTRVTNYVFNHTRIGPHRLQSSLRVREVLAIYLVNTMAILASAGLLIPWAKIRLARYRAAHLVLIERGAIAEIQAVRSAQAGATGAEAAEFFGLDIGV